MFGLSYQCKGFRVWILISNVRSVMVDSYFKCKGCHGHGGFLFQM